MELSHKSVEVETAKGSELSSAKEIKGSSNEVSEGFDANKEFSPARFSEKVNTDKVDIPQSIEKIERTSTFDDQTIDNTKMENIRPNFSGQLTIGMDHDSEILRSNLEVVTGKNPEHSNAHHIVGNDTPNAAAKLERFRIDRNSPENGIFLPDSPESLLRGSIHGQGRHIEEYSNEVEMRFHKVTNREDALMALQKLKEDLFKGNLPLHYNQEPNS